MKTLPLAALVLCLASATGAAARPADTRDRLPGTVVVPRGEDVRRIVNRAVLARGTRAGWEWVRRLEYRQSFQVRNATGRLIHHGQQLKHIVKHGQTMFSRAEDFAPSRPPLVRCLGPTGLWVRRAGHAVGDRLLEDAYLHETFRDFLFLSLPHVLHWRGCEKVYQGERPVHGVPCHQVLVTRLPGWRTFEDNEFLVSISVDDYRVVAVSFWAERDSCTKTDVFFENYTLQTDGSHGNTWWIPCRWEVFEPDGTVTRHVLDGIRVNPRLDMALFTPAPGKDAGFDADRERHGEFVPADRLPREAPRKTFFVRPPSWDYYLSGKRQRALK